jgi:hypothetical protein
LIQTLNIGFRQTGNGAIIVHTDDYHATITVTKSHHFRGERIGIADVLFKLMPAVFSAGEECEKFYGFHI